MAADARGILVVRAGPGANCSSIGSAVEMLFLSATVGAAVLLAVSAALKPEPPSTDAPPSPNSPPESHGPPGDRQDPP